VAARSMISWVLFDLGYPDQALARVREALALGREIGHPSSLAYALMFASQVYSWRGEAQIGRELADTVIALSRAQGFPSWVAAGKLALGRALAGEGDEERAIAEIIEGGNTYRALGAQGYRSGILAGVLEPLLKMGRTDEGEKVLNEALEDVENRGERYCEARLYSLKGELMRIRHSDPEAERSFRMAIRIAQSQGAKSFELGATANLARLLAKQGRRDEAHAMLANVYNWFTEGFDTTDLKDAKALLDELGA
jgi:predicted ATPase